MSQYRFFLVTAAIATLVAASGQRPARADVTIVASTSISMPGLFKSLPPAMLNSLKKSGANMLDGTPMQVTLNVSGTKMRLDMGNQITLTDSQGKSASMLDKFNRTVMEMAYVDINDPKHLAEYLRGVDVTVKDTGETKTILDQVAHHYTVIEKSRSTGIVSANLEVWAAPDMPLVPEMVAMNGPASMAQAAAWSKIKGTPLVTSMTSQSPKFGAMIFRMEVKSISRQAVADSLFTVPPAYNRISAPTMPSGSFPIGHGPAE